MSLTNDSGQDDSGPSNVVSFTDAARKAESDTPAEPARFQKHELQALFNLRAEYANLAKDYVVGNPQDDAMVAFLESAGDEEPLAVFLKGGSDADPFYLIAGPGLSTLSSNAMCDVIGHARDYLAGIQSRRDSDARAATTRKGFKLV